MKRLKVCIVDDDRDFAESMAIALEGRNCDVELAFTGEEAIDRFRTTDFDIAFMDVKLPGMNGVESYMEISRLRPYARVIMMTGYSVEQLLEKAVERGARGILHKPLDMGKVLEIIEGVKPDGILIADDDPDFVGSIGDILAESGYRVCIAQNGREVIEYILSDRINILLLDLRMPTLNGLETYRELKRIGRAVPTIIVTAYADDEIDAINTLNTMTIRGILKKPFDPQELVAAVEQLSNDRGETVSE
jgi:two-component system response regulator HydG